MADFSRWGEDEGETALLRGAGFTRRNTRRAMLAFLREGLEPGERLEELHSCTYRLQMGFLGLTDRRVIAGMSWAFLPFVKRRRAIPLGKVRSVRVRRRAWGISLDLRGAGQRLKMGNLEGRLATHLSERITRVMNSDAVADIAKTDQTQRTER